MFGFPVEIFPAFADLYLIAEGYTWKYLKSDKKKGYYGPLF
jgi:hypothetical protein